MGVDPNPMNWWNRPEDAGKRLEPCEAEYLLRKLMDLHNLHDWKCEVVGGLLEDTTEARHLGLCNITQTRIFLTRLCIERTVAEVKNTILHEIAHALTKESRHTVEWAAKAWELGTSSTEIIRTVDDEVAHHCNEDEPGSRFQEEAMAISEHVRYHESAHAVAAERLGIGLEEEGMVLNSDTDAYVSVRNTPGKEDQNWAIRRLAVKLAGPIARILRNGEAMEWETLKYSAEFHTDFEIARSYCYHSLNIQDDHSENAAVNAMMSWAARIAIECVQSNKAAIAALAEATANKASFSRTEIMTVIGETPTAVGV
jgi:hypothetical protein